MRHIIVTTLTQLQGSWSMIVGLRDCRVTVKIAQPHGIYHSPSGDEDVIPIAHVAEGGSEVEPGGEPNPERPRRVRARNLRFPAGTPLTDCDTRLVYCRVARNWVPNIVPPPDLYTSGGD